MKRFLVVILSLLTLALFTGAVIAAGTASGDRPGVFESDKKVCNSKATCQIEGGKCIVCGSAEGGCKCVGECVCGKAVANKPDSETKCKTMCETRCKCGVGCKCATDKSDCKCGEKCCCAKMTDGGSCKDKCMSMSACKCEGACKCATDKSACKCGEKCCCAKPNMDPTAQDVVTDPVCGMDIKTEGSKFSYEHEGKTYHFCCESCMERFKADPSKFLGK